MKSTLLQLDSTFSEREYGASSFRDFMEKVAQTGAVTLKNAGRSMMVESREEGADAEIAPLQPEVAPPERAQPERAQPERSQPERETAQPAARRGGQGHRGGAPRQDTIERYLSPGEQIGNTMSGVDGSDEDDEDSMPASPMSMQDGIRAVQQAFTQASPAPRWPMYVRQAKQFLKTGIEGFDERKYGFASVVDLLRAAGKEGTLRLERDRHGAVRVFPGAKLAAASAPVAGDAVLDVEAEEVEAGMMTDSQDGSGAMQESMAAEAVDESPIVDAETIEEPVAVEASATPARKGARKRKAAAPKAKAARSEKSEKTPKTPKPRARKTTRAKSEAADK
jgi:hypothetical protein